LPADSGGFRLRLLEPHSGLQPAGDIQKRVRPLVRIRERVRPRRGGIQIDRRPHVQGIVKLRAAEGRGRDARHGVRPSVEPDGLAHQPWIAAEPPLPQPVTEHHGMLRSRAEERSGAQHRKVVVRNHRSAQLLRLVHAAQAEIGMLVCHQPGKGLGTVAVVAIVRVGEAAIPEALARPAEHHQPLGRGDPRCVAGQHRSQQAENRGIHANGQRQHGRRDQGKTRGAPQIAQSVMEVGEHRLCLSFYNPGFPFWLLDWVESSTDRQVLTPQNTSPTLASW
jgi:hypothetical protein